MVEEKDDQKPTLKPISESQYAELKRKDQQDPWFEFGKYLRDDLPKIVKEFVEKQDRLFDMEKKLIELKYISQVNSLKLDELNRKNNAIIRFLQPTKPFR